jgi:hypothetical protein
MRDVVAKAKTGGVVEIRLVDDGKTTSGLGMPIEAAVTAAVRILAAALLRPRSAARRSRWASRSTA